MEFEILELIHLLEIGLVNTTMNFWVTSRGEEGDLLTT
jgi:hypothetical protein